MVKGERVLKRFLVGERIGSGGYGVVHRAWDERLQRAVAVKEIAGEAAGRVLREAHAAARLNHPAIVTLYELGEHAGRVYLVSELIEGANLRQLAAARGLSDRELAEVGAELCAALEHAHRAGVIHRDVKPENVIVRDAAAGQVYLADFGIARIADQAPLTETGQVVGTLAYMAPEQAAGEDLGPATDVYALGLTLYELWTGINPVAGPTPAATARAIGEPLPALGEIRPELPATLATSIDRCLDPEPSQRPAAADLRDALLAARGSLHPERPIPEPTRLGGAPSASGSRARPLAVLAAAAALGLLGTIAGLPGLALVLAALLVPAALLLSRPGEWLAPAAAPALGVIGLAPAFIVAAALHPRPAARAALAGLGWAWAGIIGAIAGLSLGVVPDGEPGSWAVAVPDAFNGVLAPLAGTEPLAAGLVWVGAAILLGAVLDAASPALAAVLGLVWAAVVIAALGAVGGPAAPAALLAPALLLAVGVGIWDRAGRPTPAPAREMPALAAVLGAAARLPPLAWAERDRHRAVGPEAPRAPRNPAGAPLADCEARAARTARRHVAAALHGLEHPR